MKDIAKIVQQKALQEVEAAQRDKCGSKGGKASRGWADAEHIRKTFNTERNAAGIVYPSIQTQKEYWEQRDIGGNTTPDRVEANEDRYGD